LIYQPALLPALPCVYGPLQYRGQLRQFRQSPQKSGRAKLLQRTDCENLAENHGFWDKLQLDVIHEDTLKRNRCRTVEKPKQTNAMTPANHQTGLAGAIRRCASWQDIQAKWRNSLENQQGDLSKKAG